MWDNTALLVAAQYGHSALAISLVGEPGGRRSHRCDSSLCNEKGVTPLLHACVEGDAVLAKAILRVASHGPGGGTMGATQTEADEATARLAAVVDPRPGVLYVERGWGGGGGAMTDMCRKHSSCLVVTSVIAIVIVVVVVVIINHPSPLLPRVCRPLSSAPSRPSPVPPPAPVHPTMSRSSSSSMPSWAILQPPRHLTRLTRVHTPGTMVYSTETCA